MNKFSILLIHLIFISSTLASKDENKAWLGLMGKKPIYDGQYALWHELQLRYDFERGEMGQFLVRFGLLRPINEQHELGVLMGHIEYGTNKEYRPTLQHLYNVKFSDYIYALRSRLEWRDLENNSNNSVRLRSMSNFRWLFANKMELSVWDEIFVNLTREDWTGNRLIERNRLFFGIRHDQPGIVFEYGYLNQYIPRKNLDTVEHALVINLYY
jgi:hypothetical protein